VYCLVSAGKAARLPVSAAAFSSRRGYCAAMELLEAKANQRFSGQMAAPIRNAL
jgi:hypothetical protein